MTEQKQPYELYRYISEEVRSACEANACDYKTTSQAEIERIETTAHRQYATGVEFMASLSHEEKGQCLSYFNTMKAKKYWSSSHDLVVCRIEEKDMLVPLYMKWIEEVRTLRSIIKPLTGSQENTHG